MKRKLLFLSAVLLCLSVSVFAADRAPRLDDAADLFTAEEESALLTKLDGISERLRFDVVVVTADDLGGKSCVEYADDYFDYNGFGYGSKYDGALLLISVEPGNRQCYISTCGLGINVLTDSRIDSMLDRIVGEHLAGGDYCGGAESFAELCDAYVTAATTPEPLSRQLVRWSVIGILAGLLAALLRIGSMKRKMKSVRAQSAADSYIAGEPQLTRSSELFLYHTVSRTRRQQNTNSGSTTHHSSSGRSHGGGGRSF